MVNHTRRNASRTRTPRTNYGHQISTQPHYNGPRQATPPRERDFGGALAYARQELIRAPSLGKAAAYVLIVSYLAANTRPSSAAQVEAAPIIPHREPRALNNEQPAPLANQQQLSAARNASLVALESAEGVCFATEAPSLNTDSAVATASSSSTQSGRESRHSNSIPIHTIGLRQLQVNIQQGNPILPQSTPKIAYKSFYKRGICEWFDKDGDLTYRKPQTFVVVETDDATELSRLLVSGHDPYETYLGKKLYQHAIDVDADGCQNLLVQRSHGGAFGEIILSTQKPCAALTPTALGKIYDLAEFREIDDDQRKHYDSLLIKLSSEDSHGVIHWEKISGTEIVLLQELCQQLGHYTTMPGHAAWPLVEISQASGHQYGDFLYQLRADRVKDYDDYMKRLVRKNDAVSHERLMRLADVKGDESSIYRLAANHLDHPRDWPLAESLYKKLLLNGDAVALKALDKLVEHAADNTHWQQLQTAVQDAAHGDIQMANSDKPLFNALVSSYRKANNIQHSVSSRLTWHRNLGIAIGAGGATMTGLIAGGCCFFSSRSDPRNRVKTVIIKILAGVSCLVAEENHTLLITFQKNDNDEVTFTDLRNHDRQLACHDALGVIVEKLTQLSQADVEIDYDRSSITLSRFRPANNINRRRVTQASVRKALYSRWRNAQRGERSSPHCQ